MFRWIIGSSLQLRFLVIGIAAALVVFGTLQLRGMPIDVFPEFEPPIVEVQTEALGLSAGEVESLVTLNLEELLSGVPWLESIRSESVTGLSSIKLTFERGTDLIEARQMVQERLTLAYTLPNVAQPPTMLQPVSSTNRLMMVGISSEEIEPTELSLLARWTVRPKLLGVPGVANVAIWGQRLRELHVQIDPDRLRDARLIQSDIIEAAGDALWVSPLTFLKGSAPGTGGWMDGPNQRLGVRHEMPIVTPEDMAQIAVAPQHLLMTGKHMSLGEATEVTFAHPPLIGDAFVNGGSGLLLVVEKLPSANTLEVTEGVEKALAELRLGLPGAEIDSNVFRMASYVEESIFNLTQAIIFGAVLVIFAVGAFLFSWRSALISTASIAISLLAAVFVLYLTGSTLNIMVLTGLVMALGIVIDDAIVDIERVLAKLNANQQELKPSILSIVYETTLETRSAAIYAALVIIVSIVPIYFLGGTSGALFEPLALSYVAAVLTSMLVGLSVTPALTLLLLERGSYRVSEPPVSAWFGRKYEGLLARIIGAPRMALGAASVIVLIGAVAWPFLGQSFIPVFKERNLVVSLTTAPGTSHDETYRITSRIGRELQNLPGVRDVNAHVGRAITGDQIVEVNSAQIWVGVDPDADFGEMMGLIRRTVNGFPGIDRNVHSYLNETIGEVLTGTKTAVAVRIYGQERDILKSKAEEVMQELAGIPGLVDLRVEDEMEQPQVKVEVDLEAAGESNVKPGDVRRSAATVFSGLTVGFLFEEQKIYDVVVWSAPEVRKSLFDLRDVWVEKKDRHRVRLDDVADVSIVSTPTVLRHEGIAPYIDVVGNISGRDLQSVNEEIENRLTRVDFPLEYHARILGEYIEQVQAQERLVGTGIAAVIGIFLLLQACFNSWRLALVGFLALPAAMIGGLLAVLVSGAVVSFGSVVGFFAVLGIAARSAILLIDRYRRLEVQEGIPFGVDLILHGARERMPAIVTSGVAIILALAPIVAFGQNAGLEIAQPTALVVIGGVVASTAFTLFVMPILYLAVGSGAARQAESLVA